MTDTTAHPPHPYHKIATHILFNSRFQSGGKGLYCTDIDSVSCRRECHHLPAWLFTILHRHRHLTRNRTKKSIAEMKQLFGCGAALKNLVQKAIVEKIITFHNSGRTSGAVRFSVCWLTRQGWKKGMFPTRTSGETSGRAETPSTESDTTSTSNSKCSSTALSWQKDKLLRPAHFVGTTLTSTGPTFCPNHSSLGQHPIVTGVFDESFREHIVCVCHTNRHSFDSQCKTNSFNESLRRSRQNKCAIKDAGIIGASCLVEEKDF